MKKEYLIIAIAMVVCFLIFGAALIIPRFSPPAIQIDENALTAKQLSVLCDDYVKKYGKEKDLYLSDIVMQLDSNHVGEVTMTYTHAANGRYNRYSVDINTAEHMINTMHWIDRSVAALIDFMNFAEWKVDSDEAVEIALQVLQSNGYEVDDSKLWIHGGRGVYGDIWQIFFYADSNKAKYDGAPAVLIDAHTGRVIELRISVADLKN